MDVLQTNLIPLVCFGDVDCPKNTLTFSLLSDGGTGATIDASTGVIRWVPTLAQLRPQPYVMSVRLCDNGSPSYCVTNMVSLTVTTNSLLRIDRVSGNDYQLTLLKGRTDRSYEVQQTPSLCGPCHCATPWETMGVISPASIPYSFQVHSAQPQMFFRLREIPPPMP